MGNDNGRAARALRGLLLGLVGLMTLVAVGFAGWAAMKASRKAAPAGALPAARAPQRLEKNGVIVEFSFDRGVGDTSTSPLREGDPAEVRFRLTDVATGQPLRGVTPAAWMDMGNMLPTRDGLQKECKDKVSMYLKGLVGIRPLVDFNGYHLLVLNKDPSISVIDPVVGMTGKTSLYATVLLRKAGADWVRSPDEKRLFVSMPRASQVAVVDTESFQVKANVDAGSEPTRVALQPDGRYLWVGNDALEADKSGVTVIDTESLKAVATIPTGAGHHELAFSRDDRYAFVTNRQDATVSVVDISTLKKVKDLKLGTTPISLASSKLSQMLYVADGKDGTVSVVDPARLEVVQRIQAKPGLGPLRFSEDGRWGFVVNTMSNVVHVVDASNNSLAHTIKVDGQPYQLAFTNAFAYVRLLDNARVNLINLALLDAPGTTPVAQQFPAGSTAPKLAGDLSIADSISQAATEAAVFVVNPSDNTTYFYMEGMITPMGTFANYGHNARAVTVADRSLREVEPGVYSAKLRIPTAGRYDIAFLMDSPRVLHCFSAEAAPNPVLQAERGTVDVDYTDFPTWVPGGTTPALRFKLTDANTHEPLKGLTDVTALYYATPGRHRTETVAQEVGEGLYEVKPTLPADGIYYLFLSVPSRKVVANDLPYRAFRVGGPAPATPAAAEPKTAEGSQP